MKTRGYFYLAILRICWIMQILYAVVLYQQSQWAWLTVWTLSTLIVGATIGSTVEKVAYELLGKKTVD